MSDGSNGIRARGVKKRFRDVIALNGVDLNISPGEIVALLGPNGAGKSTLIRVLVTTLIPDAGSATICGFDVSSESAQARRQIGLMSGEERSLYWRLTGRANLRFFASMHGLSREQAALRAGDLLAQVGLEDAADRPVRGYSSGMRARLSLARSLIADPPVLLLDEPTRNLDPLAAAAFRELAIDLASGSNTTILVATHDLHEAIAIADRAVVLAAGRVVLSEPVARLDERKLEAEFVRLSETPGMVAE